MSRRLRPLLGLIVVIAVVVYEWRSGRIGGESAAPGGSATEGRRLDGDADAGPTVEQLFRDHRSDVVLELDGRVRKILPDDDEGSRHQRFILELTSGHTILVAHNISLAPRVPLSEGDEIRLRGEYEWSDKGGVLHWTHHDPAGRHADGFIRHEGRDYR